jgi:hypothetical protein
MLTLIAFSMVFNGPSGHVGDIHGVVPTGQGNGDDLDDARATRPQTTDPGPGWPYKHGPYGNSNGFVGKGLMTNVTERWSHDNIDVNVFGDGLLTGDLDGDGGLEVAVYNYTTDAQSGTSGIDVLDGGNGKVLRTVSVESALYGSPAFIDINDDGKDDLLFFDGYNLTAALGPDMDPSKVFGSDPSEGFIRTPLVVADLDGDNDLEVIYVTDEGRFVSLECSDWTVEWSVPVDDHFVEQPLVVDQGEGVPSRVILTSGTMKIGSTTMGSEIIYGMDYGGRSIEWTYETNSMIVTRPVLLGRLDDIPVIAFGNLRDEVVAIEVGAAEPSWVFDPSMSISKITHISAMDVTGDETMDIAFGDTDWTVLLDGSNGRKLWDRRNEDRNYISTTGFCDVTGDGSPELLVYDDRLTAIEPGTNTTIWRLPAGDGSKRNLILFSDVDSDGLAEVVTKRNKQVSVLDSSLQMDLEVLEIDGDQVEPTPRKTFFAEHRPYFFSWTIKGNFDMGLIDEIQVEFDEPDGDPLSYSIAQGVIGTPEAHINVSRIRSAVSTGEKSLTFECRVVFGWDFPHGGYCDVGLSVISPDGVSYEFRTREVYRVETGMSFSGVLSMEANGTAVEQGQWISGHSCITVEVPFVHYVGFPSVLVNDTFYEMRLTGNGRSLELISSPGETVGVEVPLVPRAEDHLNISLGLEGCPVGAEVPVPLHFESKVDWYPVVFAGAVPANGSVIATPQLVVSIIAHDRSGSGVDPASIRYRLLNSSSPEEWRVPDGGAVEGLDGLVVSTSITLEQGRNDIQWRATDLTGNGPSHSQTISLILFDGSIRFTGFGPEGWVNGTETITSITVLLEDHLPTGELNVMVSHGPTRTQVGQVWVTADQSGQPGSIEANHALTGLQDGPYFVQWAIAGTILEDTVLSEIFEFSVDVSPPTIESILPGNGTVLDVGTTEVRVVLYDEVSGIDRGSVFVRFGKDDEWTRVSRFEESGTVAFVVEIEISEGPTNHLGFKFMDNASNIAVSPTITLVGNRPPAVSNIRPDDNSSFPLGSNVTFAIDVIDPDGDDVAYSWKSSIDGILGEGNLTLSNLSVGEHTITVVVSDQHGHDISIPIRLVIRDESEGDDDPEPSVDPSDSYWILLLILGSASMILAIAYLRSRRGPSDV